MANVGEQLTQPESGMKRIDDAFYSIKSTDTTHDSGGNGNYNNTRTVLNKNSSKVEFYVYTSKLYILGDNYGGIYRCREFNVSIDNIDEIIPYICNETDNRYHPQMLLYKKENMDKKIHHIIISLPNHVDDLDFTFDAIDIDEDGYMVYCDKNNKLYYDVTPIMTSNTAPQGYKASASSEGVLNSTTNSAYKAFDGNISNYWATKGVPNGYLTLYSINKMRISDFIISNRTKTNSNDSTIPPKTFALYGKNNDSDDYILIKNFENEINWEAEETRLYKLYNTYNYKYYKLDVLENNGATSVAIGDLRYLLAVDTPFYIINDNGVYKNYDEESNSLVEVQDTSILNADAINNTCICNLNTVKDLIDLKSNGVKVISNKNFKSKIKSIKITKQLFFANGDFSTRVANNIDYFKFNYDIPNDTIIKTVVSINSGNTWYSYIDGAWTQLDNIVPLKDYSELSSEEKIQWNTFLDEVLTKGINIQGINTLDFNTLNSEKIRFAYAIQISDANANAEAILKDLKWQFDSIGSYEQLNPKTDVNIKITNNDISITPLKNIELMKINVGISSQVPQVFDTSGLLDKETFKGKEINSVKLADKAKSLEVTKSQFNGTRKYYGVDNNDGEMKLRTFPAGTHTEHVDTYIFDNLTKGVPQTIPFVEERPEVNVMPVVFKYIEGLKNQESIFEKYSNDNITIKRNSAECTEEGIGIKDKYNIDNNIDNDIYKYPISGFDSIKNINSYRDLTRNTNFVKWRNSYTLNENSVVITNTSSASGGFLYLNEPLDKDKELNISFDFNISSSYENTSGNGIGLLFASTLDHKSTDTTYYHNPKGVYTSVAITCASTSDQRLRIQLKVPDIIWGSTSISKGVTHNLKIKIKDKKIYVWIDNNLEINGIDYSSIINKITDVYYACLYINSFTSSSIITFSNVHINDMYILEKDNKYYSLLQTNYDTDTKSYKEIEDLSSGNMNDYCIMDSDTLTKEVTINDETFKPLDKFNDFKLVSLYDNNEIRLDAIKSDKEMIISKQNLSLLSAKKINAFKQIISKENNGNCKTVFSLDNGTTWKSYDTSSQFINLINTFPLDDIDNLDPNNLSEENKTKWDNLQDEIIEKGIDADTIQTLDFATLLGDTYKNIRFAHVLIRPTYDDKVTLQNISWNIDEDGDYMVTNDIDIKVNSNKLTAISKEDVQNVKINLLI